MYQPSPGKHGFPANMVTVAPGMNPIQIPFQAIRFTTTRSYSLILGLFRHLGCNCLNYVVKELQP